ncbi:MAG: hypothetical protein CR988_04200 [Treponema sp.]|nr:MAG: hypothetical protein CR988_04200 [Treponema sp.]
MTNYGGDSPSLQKIASFLKIVLCRGFIKIKPRLLIKINEAIVFPLPPNVNCSLYIKTTMNYCLL